MKKLFNILLIVLLLTSGMFTRVYAEPEDEGKTEDTQIQEIDPATLNIPLLGEVTDEDEDKTEPAYGDGDIVRVSIKLERPATLDIYSAENVVDNSEAMAYRESLQSQQEDITKAIESRLNSKLDVEWNLTLAANIISANVEYGNIDAIRKVDGVEDVFVETRYELQYDEVNTAITTEYMTGAAQAWAQGYTGAGSRVAIIDTGVNDNHVSFDPLALEYSLTKDGSSLSDYNLLTLEEIDRVLDQLNQNNTSSKHDIESADLVYKSLKIPFAFNYVDGNYTTDHYSDSQGEHGSHVAGITAANRYVRSNGSYIEAIDAAGAIGNAPDAQIFAMKVFGAGGGAYDSDYFAAIEDAIILKADAINLSLGSGNPGSSFAGPYQSILDNIIESNSTLIMSAGNAYNWPAYANNKTGDLYLEDVSEATGGSPGSFFNTLSIAAAENVGSVGMPMKYNGENVFFTIGDRDPRPDNFYDLEGEHEFVYIDGVGDAAEFSAVSASEDLKGKILIVNRGSLSFYEKGNNAVPYGPCAMIVANNQPGMLTMSLNNYTGNFPIVLISLADANMIKQAEEKKTAGDYVYYTGKISVTRIVDSAVETDRADADITDFSSWGVPGSLTIKPEVTAPGGNIWSVDGLTDTDYESMSGTSMAAPHVTGMMAVLAQYVRENDLVSRTNGLTARNLMNSLMMSTATPMIVDGYYLPVLQQGAGLVDVNAAINAKSYILMNEGSTLYADSAKDGKVKAEFGQDADRDGVYAYAFTINNISDEDLEYAFRTDVFTQDAYQYDGLNYLDTYTIGLNASVTYGFKEHDVNMDGRTDDKDVQALLDYITGNVSGDELNLDAGEMDGKAGITSLDAQLLLESISVSEGNLIVPANTSAQVNVIIRVDDEELASRENGGYVEGFTYITCVSESEDGVLLDVEHSIPFLGFYGSWTDAGMTDPISELDRYYPNEKVSYFDNSSKTNYMEVRYPGKTSRYVFTGNPYIAEDEFPYGRLAINSDTVITRFANTYIRNVGTAATVVLNEDLDLLYNTNYGSDIFGAYYYVNGEAWQLTAPTVNSLNRSLGVLGVNEGDTVYVKQFAIPEYYSLMLDPHAKEGNISVEDMLELYKNGEIGEGSNFGYKLKIDDTAPELNIEYDEEEKRIRVSVTDNDYIAYLALTDVSGETVYEGFVPEQSGEGETFEYAFDVKDLDTNAVVVFVGDYAANEKARLVKIGEGDIIRKIVTPIYRLTDTLEAGHDYIVADAFSGTANVLMSSGTNYYTSSAMLEVREDENDIFILKSDVTDDAVLWNTKDDGSGNINFFNVKDGGALGFNNFNAPYVSWANVGYADPFIYSNNMLLYAPYAAYGYGMYFSSNNFMFGPADNIYLYVEDELVRYEKVDPDNASSIELSPKEATLILGVIEEVQMYATVEPNFIEDRTVTWKSSDESVVTVDENGLVKAIGVGEADIIVTSNQTPDLSETAHVSVVESEPMDAIVYAQVCYDDDRMEFDAIDLNTMDTYPIGEAVAPFYGGGESGSYIYGNDTDSDYYRYVITQDAIEYDGTFSGFSIVDRYALYDGTNLPTVSFPAEAEDGDPIVFDYDVIGVSKAGYLQLMHDSSLGYYDLNELGKFVAIAFAGIDTGEDYVDLYYYALTAEGEMYIFLIDLTVENGAVMDDLAYLSMGKVNVLTMGEDLTAYSMTYAGFLAGKEGVFLSDNSTKSIFFIDLSDDTSDMKAQYVGSIDGATNLSTLFDLYFDSADDLEPQISGDVLEKLAKCEQTMKMEKIDSIVVEEPAAEQPAEPVPQTEEPVEAPETDETPIEEPVETPEEPIVEEVPADGEFPASDEIERRTGFLNAAVSLNASERAFHKERVVYPEKQIEPVSVDNSRTAVVYTEDIDVKNGYVTLNFNPLVAEYLDYKAYVDYDSVNFDKENGTIRFACASLNEVEAGDPIAEFYFKKVCDDVDVNATVRERNKELGLDEESSKTIKGIGHEYYLGFWDWDEDYSGAKVYFYCKHNENHREKVYATVNKTVKEATADSDGEIVYTATAHFNGQIYTDTVRIVIPAKGHKYEFLKWEWSEDGKTAYALFKDLSSGETVRFEAAVSEVRIEPTYDEEGNVVYTATIVVDGKEYKDSWKEILAKLVREDEDKKPEEEKDELNPDKDETKPGDKESEDGKKEVKTTLSVLDAVFTLTALGSGIYMAVTGSFLGLPIAVIATAMMLLTQSLSGKLIFADKWSIWLGILALINAGLLMLGKLKKKN